MYGGPQHGGEAIPGSVLGKVASSKGIGNVIGLLAEVVELRGHGSQRGIEIPQLLYWPLWVHSVGGQWGGQRSPNMRREVG